MFIYLVDRNGTILHANHTVLAPQPDVAVGANISMMPIPQHQQKFQQAIEHAIDTGENSQLTIQGGVTGSWYQVNVAVADHDGVNVAAVMTLVEITKRVKAEERLARQTEELARSNAELEKFAYVASHDLQEPLRMVTSYTSLLAERYKGKLDAKADTYIQHAVDGATRMRGLIHDLLSLSQVGAEPKVLETTDAATLLSDTLAVLDETLEEWGGELICEELPRVLAQPGTLGTLFQNLLSNAMKFRGDRPPVIRVSAQEEDGDCVISVEDNGIGIDPEYQHKIFEMFLRLGPNDKYEGTGIGLATCSKIVERFGGKIWVESALGQGATFRFTVPLAKPDSSGMETEVLRAAG